LNSSENSYASISPENEDENDVENDEAPYRIKLTNEEIISRVELFDKLGRIIVNKEYETNIEWLFKRLFENNDFFMEFWGSKKFYGILLMK
jgi:hypothetical protein